MVTSASSLPSAPSAWVVDGRRLQVGRLWRALVAAVLLALAIGAGLYQGLIAGRASVPAAVRSHGLSQKGLLSLPLAAQGPVSAELGADGPAYRVAADQGGFRATNPAQHLSSSFTSVGVSVTSGATRVGFSLRAIGYGSALRSVAAVAPRARGNRVVYAHAGVTESYANGPLGLEQGFTLAHAPAGSPAGPLTLSIALSANAQASLASDGQSINLTREGGAVLRYSGLSVTDARGSHSHGWLQLEGGRLLLRVDTTDVLYPLRIDPFVQQGGKLTGGEEIGEGSFGYSVALSSDGNTALISGPFENERVGAAWVFTRSGSTWTQQAKLTGSGETGKENVYFGSSVALSSDGDTALIGGFGDNGEVGAAWLFRRSGETWTQQGAKLTGSGESGKGRFGYSVALSSDGNTALISGAFENQGVGAAWVFTRSGETWTQQGAKLTGSGESGTEYVYFGSSVALSSDGDTALIGASGDNGDVGAVWVFTRSGATWTQHGGKLTGSGESGKGEFGWSVALSSDGSTALLGGRGDNQEVGAAWVFTRSGETWTQQGEKLTDREHLPYFAFGASVALSSNGSSALIGGPSDGDSGRVGSAWVFTRSGATWTQKGEALAGATEASEGLFGYSVALSSDGNTALIGTGTYHAEVGTAWVFATEPSSPTVVTDAPSSVWPTSATLNATVNPNDEEVSGCQFEYGTTTSYGSTLPCSPQPGSGEFRVAVSASVESLSETTTYHFRIVATNPTGTSYGTDQTFTTPVTRQPCPKPPNAEWNGTAKGPGTLGNWEALVTVSPETYPSSGTMNVSGTATFHGQVHGEVVTLTGPIAGTLTCDGVQVFTVHFGEFIEAHYSAIVHDTEQSGTWTAGGEEGTYVGTVYAWAQSMGAQSGQVELVNPEDTLATSLSVESAPTGLPPGLVAPVGTVSYEVAEVMPGGTVDITLKLPPGSEPTAVYKLVHGEYFLYPADKTKISGDEVTLEVTDNGPWDEAPAAGVIRDPAVPVENKVNAALCTTSSGTIKLSPGLTNTAAVQTLKIKGTVSGCTGEPFTAAAYSATLKTAAAVSCSVLKGAGETTTGSSSYKWTPKTKPSKAAGTLTMLLTETPAVALSGTVATGPHSPLALSGKVSETFTGGATCGTKAVKKGAITATDVAFE